MQIVLNAVKSISLAAIYANKSKNKHLDQKCWLLAFRLL
ncbi:hypothetical protein PALI_b0646 [Pseudoalteromonas aliena SW19]|uniref:Uncharacterized protein n=1 Tax=Pseudoalteromonas aliena SW19 TaxID=1314866 RepID=A0ABR9E5K8_9GAMM|nr:hypothetical protein [Pseudoalteromonas aliena SW19]